MAVNSYPHTSQSRNGANKICKLLAGLGFPQVPGNMVPSEAVIVKRDVSGASGTPSCACSVHLLRIRQQHNASCTASTHEGDMSGQASHGTSATPKRGG